MPTNKEPGTLYLIPTNLSDPFDPDTVLPMQVMDTARRLSYFIAENAKSARRFLKAIGTISPLNSLVIRELSEHTSADDLPGLLQPVLEGTDAGVLSEAGAPAVADPGASLVALAHSHCVHVTPLVGPSALLLALMASGLNGQAFTFHGYLPADPAGRRRAIGVLEHRSQRDKSTQIFIETPYRNNAILADLIAMCAADTMLCVASNLTATDQHVCTRAISDWKKSACDLNRRPSVFLLLGAAKR